MVRHCMRSGIAVYVSDGAALEDEDRRELEGLGVAYEEGGHTGRALTGCDLVIPSPAVPPDHPILVEARRRSIPVRSEVEYAAALLAPIPMIAVTGTNGKTTTVRLLAALLDSAGEPNVVAGNVGVPLISVLTEARAAATIILEVSSFQLAQSESFRPHVGVLLNVSPDHVEYHRSYDAYVAAKRKLFAQQGPEDWAVLPRGLAQLAAESRSRCSFYDELDLAGVPAAAGLPAHHLSNLQAALCACRARDPAFEMTRIAARTVAEAMAAPHRLAHVGSLDGIGVINDSKSTNAASACAALDSVPGPVILLLGGRHKAEGYEALAEHIASSNVRHVVVFGEAAAFLEGHLERVGVSRCTRCTGLAEAVNAGLHAAQPGDTLLFSPACASFDEFADYEERGVAFVSLVRGLGMT